MTQADTGPPLELPPAAIGTGIPHLGFFLGGELYGVPLTRLREVARLTRVRAIPGAAPHVAGLVNLRGEIICALDARAILGVAPSRTFEPGFLIALQNVSYPVGLVVDVIADIFSIDPDTIAAPPAGASACVVGRADVALGSIGLIDLDRVIER